MERLRIFYLTAAPHWPQKKQFADALETASFQGNISIVERLLRGEAGLFEQNTAPDPLQVALSSGKTRQSAHLLQYCDDINKESGHFGNALAAAIASRKLGIVEAVIDAGARLDSRGRYGFPLRAAALAGHLGIATYLLKKGTDPNIRDKKLGDPLQTAAASGNLDMMLLLLSHNASVDGSGGHFGNTLQAACFNGHEQAVRLLLDHGAILGGRRGWENWRYRNALQAAVYASREDIVGILLAAGAELSELSPRLPKISGQGDGSFPFQVHYCGEFFAGSRHERGAIPGLGFGGEDRIILDDLGLIEFVAERGIVSLVDMLLTQEDVMNTPSDQDKSNECHRGCDLIALQAAAFQGHLAVVDCLLNHGVDVNSPGWNFGTPLQAALEGGHLNVAEVLLARGADIDAHWRLFGSCLQVFSERGNLEVVRFLLDRGANIDDLGGTNGNALQVACHAGHTDVVQLLLERGVDMRKTEKGLDNALQIASSAGNVEVVHLLLSQGLDVDEVGSNPETALCCAAYKGNEEMAALLLAAGAKVDGIGCQDIGEMHENSRLAGESPWRKKTVFPTPLCYAVKRGHENVVSILLEKSANVHCKGELPNSSTTFYLDMDYSDSHYRTPLAFAAYFGHTSILKRLFQHDPWGFSAHGTFSTALTTTLRVGKRESSDILLHEGINAGFKLEQFEDALQYARANGHAEFVKKTLEYFDITN